MAEKTVYILSDGTGQSAINIVKACLIQFEDPEIKLSVYSKVDNEDKIVSILEKAGRNKAFVAFTIAKKSLRRLVHEVCHKREIIHHDILGPPVEKLSAFLDSEPIENPNLLRKVDSKYFKRIEAIEFSINHDDGKNLKNLEEADIIILGLSRTSKTPTSFFLAQQGYKVVNIPVIPEVGIPEEVYKADQNKIVCLMMEPDILQKIRIERLKHYRTMSKYTNINHILEEVEFMYALKDKHRKWHIVDTTSKSVEETAREVLMKIYGREIQL
ncbi:pyruvate, water dikinase regulatory protein [Flexistipes sinusarabici]|uniref:Putative pyruvate, phosphate dikinase regulatory protein n=1 Tax=Flexistipes sinusarabici TaxID=2352 RepID=A0A5D0MP62_FLESI|nr:pyruvate, water dikinase regulatory protein [Flexistipes sinusarabici]TYB33393.1 MAG: kinase/pyrophosphorylase [Flexistipes sinusarabici]